MNMPELKPEIHDWNGFSFGDTSSLRVLAEQAGPKDRVAMIVSCSELGFAPDQNSLLAADQCLFIQNFGNVAVSDDASSIGMNSAKDAIDRGIEHVIVCGHTNCITISHFLEQSDSEVAWIAEGTELSEFMAKHYSKLNPEELHAIAIREQILLQIRRLHTSANNLGHTFTVYGWLLDTSQRVSFFDPASGQFSLN